VTDAQLDPRLDLARAFLMEAVYRSRSRQAAGAALAAQASDVRTGTSSGGCGLGEKAALELDSSERGARLAAQLWPTGLAPLVLEHVHSELAAWVALQDGLDRKRNHFLRDFRAQHGFDRRAYAPAVSAAYDAELARINGEVDERLATSARRLLEKA
jgi:hypothetical protein